MEPNAPRGAKSAGAGLKPTGLVFVDSLKGGGQRWPWRPNAAIAPEGRRAQAQARLRDCDQDARLTADHRHPASCARSSTRAPRGWFEPCPQPLAANLAQNEPGGFNRKGFRRN